MFLFMSLSTDLCPWLHLFLCCCPCFRQCPYVFLCLQPNQIQMFTSNPMATVASTSPFGYRLALWPFSGLASSRIPFLQAWRCLRSTRSGRRAWKAGAPPRPCTPPRPWASTSPSTPRKVHSHPCREGTADPHPHTSSPTKPDPPAQEHEGDVGLERAPVVAPKFFWPTVGHGQMQSDRVRHSQTPVLGRTCDAVFLVP